MDMDALDFPPFLISIPSEGLEDYDCSQLTMSFEDGNAAQIDEEEDFSRTMALMENDLDRRVKRANEDLRRLRHGKERPEKPARRGSIKRTNTLPTADSATEHDVTQTALNGSRRRLPSAKRHLKKIGSFLYDPTSKRPSFPSPAAIYRMHKILSCSRLKM